MKIPNQENAVEAMTDWAYFKDRDLKDDGGTKDRITSLMKGLKVINWWI